MTFCMKEKVDYDMQKYYQSTKLNSLINKREVLNDSFD